MQGIALFLGVLLVVPAGALVSQPVQLDSGSRIRVWASAPSLVRQTGTLNKLQADTLRFSPDRRITPGRAPVAVPFAHVTRLDVSRKRHSRGRKALGGAILGLVVGAAIGYGSGGDCERQIVCWEPAEGAAFLGGVFLGAGAIIGALLPPSEKWERLPNVGSP